MLVTIAKLLPQPGEFIRLSYLNSLYALDEVPILFQLQQSGL